MRVSLGESSEILSPLEPADPGVEAALRALPIARLEDYGIAHADALSIHAQARSGISWTAIGASLSEVSHTAAAEFDRLGSGRAARDRRYYSALTLNICQIPVLTDEAKAAAYTSIGEILETEVGLKDTWRTVRDGTQGLWAYAARPSPAGPAPTVLIWGGLSGWGIAYMRLATQLLSDGFAVVLIELPGQGLSRVRSDRRLDMEMIDDLRAVCKQLRSEGIATSIGILGNSAGGLFAAHAAHHIEEIKAVCLNSGTANPMAMVKKFPRLAGQWSALLGIDEDRVPSVLEAWRFRGNTTPLKDVGVLVLHGGRDVLVNEHDQHEFLAAANPARASMVVWQDCGHCSYERHHERDVVIATWFGRELR